jgi:hypothetical protein
MAKKPKLNLDLKEVLSEMSKAPGGNVAQPRPVTPGPILGGPKEFKPGVVDPATGVRTRGDTALELFRFYAYGAEKTRDIPVKEDTKTVTVTKGNIPQEEQLELQARKDLGWQVKQREERARTRAGIRGGVIGGMTRAPGSKPPIKNIISTQLELQRAREKEMALTIRDALEKAFGASSAESSEFGSKYTPELGFETKLTRDEQKYLDLLQRRIQDAMLDREAALKEALAARGDMTSAFEDYKEQQEADKRTLEGRQVAEVNRKSRAKTEYSLRDLPDKIVGRGGTGLASFDFVSLILNANLMYEQMVLEQERAKRQIT